LADHVAEGVIVVGVGHRSGGIDKLANRASAVLLIEARRPLIVNDLVLANVALSRVLIPCLDFSRS
jgi:hypothetical protein